MMKRCMTCGKPLEGKPSVVKRRKYCSRACSGKSVGFQKGNRCGIRSRFSSVSKKSTGIRNKKKIDYILHRLYLAYIKVGWKYVEEEEFEGRIRAEMKSMYEKSQDR